MKHMKQMVWAALFTLVALSISWAQVPDFPFGAQDMTYGLRSRIAEDPSFQYTPSPQDWRDVNIYQIFTDRFASSGENITYIQNRGWYAGNRTDSEVRNFHHGGDWKGLQQNIPYLKGMGVNAVWISGVQMNDQGKDTRFTPYHMYHPTDFFKVDPAMGTFQDLKNAIDALHANGIYVILDVVINHTADKNGLWGNNQNDDKGFWAGGNGTFGWWDEGNKHAEPFNLLEHFHNNGTINCWDCFPETLLGQFKGTDDLKTESEHVTFWITEAFKNLIDATDCDGFRVDAIKHVEYNWVKKWADDIRKHAEFRGKNDFILFGELFVYDNNALASYCKDEGYSFNSALFFPMSQTIKSVFIDGGGTGQLTQQLNNRFGYGEGANRLVTFIDNHDVNRISILNGGDTGNDIWKLRPALSFLYLATPVPCLFYGTEHAFNQGDHFNGSNAGFEYDDADWQRETMFDKGFQPGPAQGNKLAATDAPLYQHIAALNDARSKYRALTRGDFTQRWDSGGQGPYAFTRKYNEQEALVALNTADGVVSLQPQVTAAEGTEFVNVLNPDEKVSVSGGRLAVSLGGKETKVFVSGVAGSSFLAVNDSPTSHDYATLNYYINEPTDSELLTLDLYPGDSNVEEAQIWSNLGRRDYATLGDQDALSVPGPAPAGTNYFVGFPMSNVGGNQWRIEMPVDKTGAYRATARYRVAGSTNWTWIGGRDLAIMVSPKKARDVILYEAMVNVINATGDTEATRSTFEDMMDPAQPGNLDHFEDLGVNTLWIQPIHPIGANPCPTIGPGEGPGSPYSIKNMWDVAPHMSQGNTREASMAAFTNFAAAAQERDIDFFFDIIFNHTSWDAEIGRDPDDPTRMHPTPSAQIKDLYPQWYSRYTSTSLPCGGNDYIQSNFAFQFPAQNAGQLGPAPAERNDFGKWPDVVDLFWGTYPALLDPQAADDTYWDTTQTGADVERMAEYFAYFGQYWIEQSGGTLGGFRCDYAQGLPPQAWEYFVNKIRQTKWDFIFMAESLDGGNVSKRAGRHMDIINQNWVWQVLDQNNQTASGIRGIVDQNKTDYGYAGIMRGIINHDQNAPDDKWYTFSRYAVGTVIDGAPQIYMGQELGYTNGYGFSQFREQYDREIPHIFKWHNMQTLWDNRDALLEDAYSRVNKGRQLANVNRLHDQWYLDTMAGGPDEEIFSVLKYEKFGWDAAHQDVVLNFVNLTPGTEQIASFDLRGVDAVYIDPSRTYNARNLTSDDPNAYIWGDGISGQELLDQGVYIGMPADIGANPQWALVQMIKIEEHDASSTNPVDRTYVSWTPEAPIGCEELTIRYAKTGGPLSAGPVLVHVDVNGWAGMTMAEGSTNWLYTFTPAPGVETINFTFSDGSGTWEGADFSVTFGDGGCTGEVPVAVWTEPETITACEPVTIYYNAAGRPLAAADPVTIYIGQNGFQDIVSEVMTVVSNDVWSYTYTPTTGTKSINFLFNDGNPDEGSRIWDNNGGNDWNVAIGGCGDIVVIPDFAVTFPTNNTVVANGVGTYTITGVASNMSSQLRWTNSLTGESSLVPVAGGAFSIPQVGLAVGTNVITITGTTGGSGGVTTNAIEQASNYSDNWASGASRGTGFGNWTLDSSESNAGHFTGANGFGLWSYEGFFAAAALDFTSALSSGQTFRVRMENGWIWENGGSIGLALRDGGDEKWLLYFNGGSNFYFQGSTSAVAQTDIPWTDSGMDVAFTLTGDNSYSVTLTPLAGTPRVYTGTFSGTIDNVRAWSSSNGNNDEFNSNRDYFFDNLMITTPGSAGSVTSTTVTIIRLPEDADETDSNNDGIPDSWMVKYGLDVNTPATNASANGMTYWESFMAGLDPTDPDDYLMLESLHNPASPGGMQFRWFARPVGAYKVMASREHVAGPYTNMVASRTTENGASYHITIEDPMADSYETSYYRLELVPSGDTDGGGGVVTVTVSAAPGSTVFTNVAGLPVTLSVNGGTITESTYTISTNAAVTFTNGQIVTIGDELAPGESLSMMLFARNASGGSDRKTYTYTRASGIAITNTLLYNTFPPNGQITSSSEIWIDAFSQPTGAGVSADVIYCAGGACTGEWTVASMSRNEAFDNPAQETEWWNINLGTFPAGTEIQYAVVIRDGEGTEIWDNNGGANYSATVNSDGGGGEPGGMTPPSTNPTFGQNGSATIDGANTSGEWSDSNLIAIDMANDDPRSLGSNWTMHEGPADLTHLWAKWDDNNLYLAWQFVDITDILDPSNAGSAQGSSVFNSQGILQFISIDTGVGGAANYMWDKFDSFGGSTLPNFQLAMRSDLWGEHPYLSKAVDGAFVVDKDLGTNYFTRTQAGIQIAKGQLNASSAIYGVGDIDNYLNNPSVTLNNYIGHDTSRDTFYEMSIPLATLGITRAQIESSGIGVFISAGSASSIDSIPNDPSTLDTPGVTDSNSTWEWEDGDVFTRPFARIGGN
jgi:glycosidase